MDEELPNYFETFEPNRVPQGSTIDRVEMARRLSHYLHIPQRFGLRILMAFESVMSDALMHGEGLKIKDAGTLTLRKHKTETFQMFGKTEPRKILYKYKWVVSESAKRFLEHISNITREGAIGDHFSNPEDPKF